MKQRTLAKECHAVLLVAMAVAMPDGPAVAHHSFAMFDFSKEVTITGTLRDLQWTNPHIHILVSAPAVNGGMVDWDVEGATPANLKARGWSRDVIKPGEKISIVIHPLKNGSSGGELVSARRGDGTVIGSGGGQ